MQREQRVHHAEMVAIRRAAEALEHVEEAERLARQLGGEPWVEVLERLVALLRARGQRDRISMIAGEAAARLGTSTDPSIRRRIAALCP